MEPITLVCAVVGCEAKIREGETYFLLGGGKVINCHDCACHKTFKVTVNDKEVTLTRGWDKIDNYIGKNLRKTFITTSPL